MRYLTYLWLVLVSFIFALTSYFNTPSPPVQKEVFRLPAIFRIEKSQKRFVSLGHQAFYDDLATVWLTQSIFDRRVVRFEAESLADGVVSMAGLGLGLESFYAISCFFMLESLNRSEACLNIAKRGMEALPDSYVIPLIPAFAFLFAGEKEMTIGLPFLKWASTRSEAPAYLRSLYRRFESGELGLQEDDQIRQDLLKTLGKSIGRN